jgi:hypothetical protein
MMIQRTKILATVMSLVLMTLSVTLGMPSLTIDSELDHINTKTLTDLVSVASGHYQSLSPEESLQTLRHLVVSQNSQDASWKDLLELAIRQDLNKVVEVL